MSRGPNIDTAGQSPIPDLCLICNADTHEHAWIGSDEPTVTLIDAPACFACSQLLKEGGELAVNYLVAERDRLAQMVIDRIRLDKVAALLADSSASGGQE